MTNGGLGATMSLYYALNVAGGTQKVTVTFGGLSGTPGRAQGVISEFYNIAPVAAGDGSGGSASSRTVGPPTTATDGDLIYHWGAALSNATDEGATYNGTLITAGNGFTLLSADLQVGSADQFQVQPTAGPVSPVFSASGNSTWGSLVLALKSASAGTVPAAGIRVVHAQYTLLAASHSQNRTANTVIQFPSSGNLLVGLFSAVGEQITCMTDSSSSLAGIITTAVMMRPGHRAALTTLRGPIARRHRHSQLQRLRIPIDFQSMQRFCRKRVECRRVDVQRRISVIRGGKSTHCCAANERRYVEELPIEQPS